MVMWLDMQPDGAAKKIYKVDTSGNRVETWDAFGDSPSGLAYDNGYLWHTDWSRYKVWKLDMGGGMPEQVTLYINSGAYHIPEGIHINVNPPGETYSSQDISAVISYPKYATTAVTITVSTDPGYEFTYWLENGVKHYDNPFTIIMDSDKVIEIHGRASSDQFTLTLASDPPEGGTITATPSGGTYDAGTVVTLTAVPNNGYAFKGWTGTGITDTTSLTTTVTINSDVTVTAHFEKTTAHMWWLLPLIVIIVISGAGATYYIKKKH